MKTKAIIVAIDLNNGIGRNNDLMWRLRSDLRRFKEITTGHTLLMGRKTFESLPKGALPNRRNCVVTRNPEWSAPNTERFDSIESAIQSCTCDETLFVIGGGEIYQAAFDLCDQLYLTEVQTAFEDADTFFPLINRDEWAEIKRIDSDDEGDDYPYIFRHLTRK